jgi:hypothetical protein
LLDGSGNELSEDYGNGQESAWQPDPGSLGKNFKKGQLQAGTFTFRKEVASANQRWLARKSPIYSSLM